LATALRELKKRFGPYANIYEGKPERELLEATAVAIEAGSSIPVRAAPDAIDVPERADDPRWDDAVWMRTTILRFVATRGMLASAPQPERKPT
jgi:hypothetical protein